MKLSGKLLVLVSMFILVNHTASAKTKKHHRHHSSHARAGGASNIPVNGAGSLNARLAQIVADTDPHAEIGVQVKSMKSGDVLYSHNEQRLYTPASTAKLFTAAAAYIYLGSDYKFTTNIATTAASTNNGVIDGDVYLIHSGDPSLTYYDLTDLMVTLQSMQIHTINGNVYVDNTAYDQDNFGPGWEWSDTRYCYAAPINASIINHNCISFSISPAKTVGHLASITENPRYYYSAFSNQVVTKAGGRSCHVSLNLDNDNTINLSGCLPRGHYSRGASIVIANIVKYNQSMLKSLMRQYDIQVNGRIDARAAPANLSVLASHESKPLNDLISEMLKKSDNIIAGSIFKKLGEAYTKRPGSWSTGAQAVKEILGQKGVNTSSMTFIDGSGLSRDDRVSASQFIQVLDYSYHNFSTNYEFVSALPIAGVDGTLKNRLSNVRWKVRAKTGTMAKTGVVSLAGYAISKDKEPIAFAIIVNGHYGNVWKYREMEDKIVTALANFSR